MPEPEVERAADRQDAPALFPLPAVAELLRRRPDVRAGEVGGAARDPGEAAAQLPLGPRGEPGAVAEGGVDRVIVGPGDRPVVAVLRPADDVTGRGPVDAHDD